MNPRDYFAGQALGALLCQRYDVRPPNTIVPELFARCAYDYADAMMAERGKRMTEREGKILDALDSPDGPIYAINEQVSWEDEVNEHATETEENYG